MSGSTLRLFLRPRHCKPASGSAAAHPSLSPASSASRSSPCRSRFSPVLTPEKDDALHISTLPYPLICNAARPSHLRTLRAAPSASVAGIFPPKDDTGVDAVRATATALKRMAPDFVSVTYGAGGTTRDRTAQVCDFLKRDFDFTVMPHLTCVGHTRAELSEVADRIYAGGFRNIMTLRGDPPKGRDHVHALQRRPPLRQRPRRASEVPPSRFRLGVGGYPEKHPEAPSSKPTSLRSKSKSTPARTSSRRSSFSTTPCITALWTNAAPPALLFRSSPALCPCSR